jgi:hypothetical protein
MPGGQVAECLSYGRWRGSIPRLGTMLSVLRHLVGARCLINIRRGVQFLLGVLGALSERFGGQLAGSRPTRAPDESDTHAGTGGQALLS